MLSALHAHTLFGNTTSNIIYGGKGASIFSRHVDAYRTMVRALDIIT